MPSHATPGDQPGHAEPDRDGPGSESMLQPARRSGRARGSSTRSRPAPPSDGGFSLDWPPLRPGRDGYYGSGA